MIRRRLQAFGEMDRRQAHQVRSHRAAHWAFGLLIAGLVLTGCDSSPGARKKKRDERWLKGRVFAELRILEKPRRQLLPGESAEPEVDFAVYRQSQARLLTGPMTLMVAMRKPEIASNRLLKEQAHPLDWLEENLVVDFPSTEFIRISMKSDQKAEAAQIVNAVVDAYLTEHSDSEHGHRQKRRTVLEKARDDLNSKVKVMQAKIRRLAEEVHRPQDLSDSPQSQAILKFRELAVDELAREELARAKDQVQLAVLRAASEPTEASSGGAEPSASADLSWLETSIEEHSMRITEWRRILEAQVIEKRSTAIHSLELKSMEQELEEVMDFMQPIREELLRLEVGDKPEGRVSIFRKAEPG